MDEKVYKAQQKFKKAQEHWQEIFEKLQDDLYFQSDAEDAQWNELDINSRRESGRPVLTIDQLSQYVHQVVNDGRLNTPTINVIPKTGADLETAEILKGLIRHIQEDSRADEAYDNALDFAVKCSLGFIRVDHEYEDKMSFDQKLCIKPVINPTSVYLDPDSIKVDGSDAKYGFVLDEIPVTKFKEEYPDKQAMSFEEINYEYAKERKDNEVITLAEYFTLDQKEIKIGKRIKPRIDIETGVITTDEVIEEVNDEFEYQEIRTTTSPIVRRFKMSGVDVLEETTFPGDYIPIVPVYGEISYNGGVRSLFSLIRRAKDAQRAYNFWRSIETEILMKQPQAPIMAAEGQTENYSDDWTRPEKSNVLRYKTTDSRGNPVPPPQRLAPPQIAPGIMNAAMQTVNDIQATLGMYGAAVGQRSNEVSGVAIDNRKIESDMSTYHFVDNRDKSITQVGRVLVSAIPEIYDTPRILSIIDDEEEISSIGVNGAIVEGQERMFDLTDARYSVKVTTGVPFTTQRQEASTYMKDIVVQRPEMLSIIGDLLFKYSDFPGSQAISERMKKTMNPTYFEEESQEAAQYQAIIQQLQGQVQQLAVALQNKDAEEQLKTQIEIGKLNLEARKLELDKMKALGDYDIKSEQNEIKAFEANVDAEHKEVDSDLKIADRVIDGIVGLRQSQSNNGLM